MARHYRLARTVWTAVSKAPAPQLLSGADVMDLLGIEPGPAVGRALDALEEEVEAGEVTDVEGARAFLEGWWQDRAAAAVRPRQGRRTGARCGRTAGTDGEAGAGPAPAAGDA